MSELEESVVALNLAMVETRRDIAEAVKDIQRLYAAWPQQFRAVNDVADRLQKVAGEIPAALVHELQRIHDRLDALEKK